MLWEEVHPSSLTPCSSLLHPHPHLHANREHEAAHKRCAPPLQPLTPAHSNRTAGVGHPFGPCSCLGMDRPPSPLSAPLPAHAQRGGAVQERWGTQSGWEVPPLFCAPGLNPGVPPAWTASPTSPAQPLPFVLQSACLALTLAPANGVQRKWHPISLGYLLCPHPLLANWEPCR
jgi:hypothetical protein